MLPLENRLSSRSDTGREELLPGVRAHLCGSHLSVPQSARVPGVSAASVTVLLQVRGSLVTEAAAQQ